MSAARAEPNSTAASRPRGAPAFRSALIEGGPGGGALRPRRLRGGLVLSIVAHVFGVLALMALSLFSVEAIPAPPIVIHFLAAPPPPPQLVPPRPAVKPAPEPVPKSLPRVSPVPPLALPAPPARRQPRLPPLEVEAAPKVRPADIEPQPRTLDLAPPPPRGGAPSLGALAAVPTLPGGREEEPELVFLTAGRSRPRGPGGGLAGPGDGVPSLSPADDPSGAARGGRGGGRHHRTGAGAQVAGVGGDGGTGVPFDGSGLAAFLGRKYGAALVEAARLGQRTSDGARYNMLVPMLTEAYRQIAFRGAWRAAGSDASGVVSAQVDRDAVAIHYHDGTLHVVVPTHDGLVALYVSADRRTDGRRTKVDEAERALEALRRLAQVRS